MREIITLECTECKRRNYTTTKNKRLHAGRVEYKNTWKIRWFPNKFPAVEFKGNAGIKTKNKFLSEGKTYGKHDIIVETPNHKKQLWDLSTEDIKNVFEVYALRIKSLSKLTNIKYVTVFKNHGPLGGTSLVHSHTQIVAISVLPLEIIDEVKAAKKFNRCPYCDIIKLESKSKRKITHKGVRHTRNSFVLP